MMLHEAVFFQSVAWFGRLAIQNAARVRGLIALASTNHWTEMRPDFLAIAIWKVDHSLNGAAVKLGVSQETLEYWLAYGIKDAPFCEVARLSKMSGIPLGLLATRRKLRRK